jgi:hypothetical protein
MIYRKYSFAKKEDYEKAIEALKIEPIDGVKQPQVRYTAIPVLCYKTRPTYKDGEIETEGVIDTNHNVDILWAKEEPESFVPYQIWPSGVGQHIVAGWEEQYEKDRLKFKK